MNDWADLDRTPYPASGRMAVVLRAPSRGKLLLVLAGCVVLLVVAGAFGLGTGYAPVCLCSALS